jgi:Fe-Mn family superoxide dismutase
MARTKAKTYKEQKFDHLKGLDGISDKQVDEHLALYAGYVKQVNALNEELARMRAEGKVSGKNPEFAELTRRLGFEYDGMILHEYYFSNLRPAAEPQPAASSALASALGEFFGSVDAWRTDFQAIGEMRGIGWVILFEDPMTDKLTNHWVTLHQEWTCGSTRSCGTTRRPTGRSTSKRSSGTSTGPLWSAGSSTPLPSVPPPPPDRMLRTVALLVALAAAVSGCSALTGRPFIQWSDDKAIQTRVKARLAAVSLKHLSRIHVDVYEATVYLGGLVDSDEAKHRAEAAVTAVEGVRQVVSHVLVSRRDDSDPMPAALPVAAVTTTIPEPLVGVAARLEGARAYDLTGRLVATVYTVPMSELAHASAERFNATGPVTHVTIHAMTGNAQVPLPHYVIVLWHGGDPQTKTYTPAP